LLGERRGDPAAPFSFRLDAAKVAKRLRLLTKVLKLPGSSGTKGGTLLIGRFTSEQPSQPRTEASFVFGGAVAGF
jgi:hypothetical protein